MSSTTLMPVEEYLRLSGKPNCEYRNGVLTPKSMPTTFHGLIEFMLVLMLRRLGLQAAPEVTIRLSSTEFLVPDVVAGPVLQIPYPSEAVLLCCEILSPDDRLSKVFARCEEYHAWGVPFCWIVDPVERTAWEYHSSSEPVREPSTLAAGEYAVSLAELFSVLD